MFTQTVQCICEHELSTDVIHMTHDQDVYEVCIWHILGQRASAMCKIATSTQARGQQHFDWAQDSEMRFLPDWPQRF